MQPPNRGPPQHPIGFPPPPRFQQPQHQQQHHQQQQHLPSWPDASTSSSMHPGPPQGYMRERATDPATEHSPGIKDENDDDGQPPLKKMKGAPAAPAKRKTPAKDGQDKGKDKDAKLDKDGKEKEKEKKTRSRAACLSCKSTKQRCDGPSRIPCRRCELYGLECKFPSTAQVIYASAPDASQVSTDSPLVTQKLYEIASRLQSIESALRLNPSAGAADHTNFNRPESSHTPSLPARSSRSPSMEVEAEDDEDGNSIDGSRKRSNPLQFVLDTVGQAVGPEHTSVVPLPDDFGFPDVLKRNILTTKECQELFDFFFLGIHPWVMMLSLDTDRDALAVRARSSLLFHTILLLASSYSSPFPSHLHATLVTFTNAIFAPHILSPQPHELTTDFLRAVDLLNLYKPTQFGARRAEGKNDAEAMVASKVNGLASWMLQGILGRTATRLELHLVLNRFSKAYSASGGVDRKEIPHDVARDLRLYYWLLCNDVHGNVQSGRRCNMEGATAMATTRLFSSLQLQPYDTRLAASVEMFENARPILRSSVFEKFRRISQADLDRFNQGMSAWEEFWVPVLIRQLSADHLAMTVLSPFAWVIVLTFNSTVWHSWLTNRMFSAEPPCSVHSGERGEGASGSGSGGGKRVRLDSPRGLSSWEFDTIQTAVTAAESLIFTLCEESRVKGAWRQTQWKEAERVDGWRKLALDQSVTEHASWGMDAVTCVSWVFPAVFLCKLANEGVLTEDLVLLAQPTPQGPWKVPRKLPRLLELAGSFLEAVSLNPHHPSKVHARAVRSLLDAGVRGLAAPKPLPRHATTVLSSAGSPSASYPGQGMGPPADAGRSAVWENSDANSLAQWQQQQQNQDQARQLLQLSQMGGVEGNSLQPGEIDQSLSGVLDRFDPALYGDSSAFWGEWGGVNAGNVDWSALSGMNTS